MNTHDSEVSISSSVDAYITDVKSAKPSFRLKGIHPSEIGQTPFCLRQHILKHIEDENGLHAKSYSPRTLRIFDIGHYIHDQWRQEYLGPNNSLYGLWKCSRCHKKVEGLMPWGPCSCTVRKRRDGRMRSFGPHTECSLESFCGTGEHPFIDPSKIEKRGGCLHCARWGKWEYVEYAIKIPNIAGFEDLHVVGHVDGILVHDDGTKSVLDIKSISSKGFDFLSKPKTSYVYQIHLYMKAFNIKKGILLYVNKDDGEMKEFVVHYDESIIQEIEQRVRDKVKAIDVLEKEDNLPAMHKKCTPRSTMRSYCAYGGLDGRGGCPLVTNGKEFVDYHSGNYKYYYDRLVANNNSIEGGGKVSAGRESKDYSNDFSQF